MFGTDDYNGGFSDAGPIGNYFTVDYIRTRIAHFTDRTDIGAMHRGRAVGMVESEMMNSEWRPTFEAVAWWMRQAKVVDAMVAEFGADPDSPLLQDGGYVEASIAGELHGASISGELHGLTMVDLNDMSEDAWDMAWDDFGKAIRRGEGNRKGVPKIIKDHTGQTIAAPLQRHGPHWFLGGLGVNDLAEIDLLFETDRRFDPANPGTMKPIGFNAVWLRVTIHYHGDRAWAYLPTTGLPMRAEVLPTALFRWPV